MKTSSLPFLFAALVSVSGTAYAEPVIFHDDFERTEIGDAWLPSGGSWWIEETEEWGHVLRSGSSNPHVLLYQDLELDQPWEMEINFHFLGMEFSWGGVTFHGHFDAGVFRNYVSRMKTMGTVEAPGDTGHQFIEFENFGIQDFRTIMPQAPLTMEVPYRMVISSAEAGSGVFEFTLYDADDNPLIETVIEVPADWGTPLTGGWAGLYDIRNLAVYDFRLRVGEPVTEGITFEAWQETHFTADQISDPEIGGPLAAPAGDGIANLLKYALRLSPWESSRQLLPQPVLAEDHLTLTYHRPKGAADIVHTVEVATELPSWQSGPEHAEEISVVDRGETEQVTVRAVSPAGAEVRQFMRLRVEQSK